jgi:hypothetical protein
MSAPPTGRTLRAIEPAPADRLLAPIHRWIWRDPVRRARKLLAFAETEADGGRDLVRAAERTHDALLRRLYLRHAMDERRHAELFRRRGGEILRALPRAQAAAPRFEARFLAPGERGLDDLRLERETEASLLAFLHLSERTAARRFAVYERVLAADPTTRNVFVDILHDETFHMNYTYTQLERIDPARRRRLWRSRAGRLWKAYLRIATAIAGLMGAIVLTVQYFVVLPLFALLAKRNAARERPGFRELPRRDPAQALRSQY